MATLYVEAGYLPDGYVQTGVFVDWPTKVIYVPQFFLTFIGGSVYELDTDAFRLALKDEEDSEKGIVFPRTNSHNTTVLLGGIEYARVLEIINGYTITFEETGTPYVVNILGSNNNILDVTNLGTVQLRSNNSAGLINVREIQQDIFGEAVNIDQTNGQPGNVYPAGTSLQPVSNVNDAAIIAEIRGFDSFHVQSNYVFGASDVVNDKIFEGDSSSRSTLVLTAAATITNCIFRRHTITGQLDGGNDASFCVIAGLNYIDGSLLDCFLATGDVVLGGAQANIIRCGDAVAGAGVGEHPWIDLNGGGTNLVVEDYNGGIGLKNCSTDTGNVTLGMSSGRVVIDSTVTAGTYVVRGIADVEDNSTGTAVIVDNTINKAIADIVLGGGGVTAQQVWEYNSRSLTDPTGVQQGDIDAIAAAVWASVSRTLTETGNIATADVNAIRDAVWLAASRTLTDPSGVTAQDITDIADAVWDKVI